MTQYLQLFVIMTTSFLRLFVFTKQTTKKLQPLAFSPTR